MPGTTPRGYPYPLGTEPADGSANIEAGLRAVDTDIGSITSQAYGHYVSTAVTQSAAVGGWTRLIGPPAGAPNAPVLRGGVTHDSTGILTLPKAGRYMLSMTVTIGWHPTAYAIQIGWGTDTASVLGIGGVGNTQTQAVIATEASCGIYAAAAGQKVAVWVNPATTLPYSNFRIQAQYVGP